MVKFDITSQDLAKLEKRARELFKEAISDPKLMTEVGKVTADRLRYQARVARPYNTGNDFPPLKSTTISKRNYLAKYNDVDPTFKASRSNLTLSGKFLNSLGFTISGPGEVTLQFIGVHPGYKNSKGKVRPGPKMSELFQYLKDKSFVAFSLDGLNQASDLRKRLSATVSAYLRRSLKT